MKLLLKYIREAFQHLLSNVRGSKIKEYEQSDPLSKTLLYQHIAEKNAKRAVLSSSVGAVLGIIVAVAALVTAGADNLAVCVLRVCGAAVIVAASVFFGTQLFSQLKKRMTNWKKLNFFTAVFWAAVIFGLLLSVIADFISYKTSQTFYLCVFIMLAIPLLQPKVSLIYGGAFFAVAGISALLCGIDVTQVLLYLLFTLAYMWLSCVIYSSYCCLWISERQLNNANERCRQITEKDSLTGMLNKKGLSKRLIELIATGNFENIAAIFIDIDDFKGYNLLYSDQFSDDTLHNVCNCIRIISKPKTDIISRFGGDEFIVVLTDTSEYELISFAEQLRKSIETMALPFGDGGKVLTITVGVSALKDKELENYNELLKEAEASLQTAKNAGKNCVGYGGKAFKTE